jgi:hypothetical protein
MKRCKACGRAIDNPKRSYLIDREENRICKKCGDAIMKNENAKESGPIKVIEVKNGEKAIVLTR